MRTVAALAMVLVATMASMQAQAQVRHGSIAFSQRPDGGYEWGIAWNAASREAAQNQAIQRCRSEGGRSCTEIMWFRNTCAALAIGGGNGWGTGAGATTADAQRIALDKCRTTNRDCRIAVSGCANASAEDATAERSFSSAKADPETTQRTATTRDEPTLTPAGRRQIQQALAASGFNPGGADGIFGPKTRAALRAWQTANGHAATGQLTSEQIQTLVFATRKTPGFVTPPIPRGNLTDILAAGGARADQVAQLLSEGHDPNAQDQAGSTPLHYAAAEPDPDAVRLLLSAGARCDPRNNDGNTPLHVAANTGSIPPFSDSDSVATIRLLLECGANPNAKNNDGDTPLHTAFTGVWLFGGAGAVGLTRGDPGVVGALLRGGANPNAENNDGDTPLILAVQETDQYAKTVRVLLEHGANPDTRNREGSAVLHIAAEEYAELPEIIAALLAGGADPDAKDKQEDTALHIVVKKRRDRTGDIKALLVGGADPCVRDRKRNIPIAYAEKGSRADRLLYRAGGIDWVCDEKDEKTVAEAPKQETQATAGRSLAQEEAKTAVSETASSTTQKAEPYVALSIGTAGVADAGARVFYFVGGIGRGEDEESARKAAKQECQRQGGSGCGEEDERVAVKWSPGRPTAPPSPQRSASGVDLHRCRTLGSSQALGQPH